MLIYVLNLKTTWESKESYLEKFDIYTFNVRINGYRSLRNLLQLKNLFFSQV